MADPQNTHARTARKPVPPEATLPRGEIADGWRLGRLVLILDAPTPDPADAPDPELFVRIINRPGSAVHVDVPQAIAALIDAAAAAFDVWLADQIEGQRW
jgi:hypothetical protein